MSDLPPGFVEQKLWELRTPNDGSGWLGVRKFETPEELWAAACSYFEWVTSNPLQVEKAFCSNGVVVRADLSKARAMTIHGLCLYLRISRDTLHKWGNGEQRPDLAPVVETIKDVIYTQKFEGAAADIFNPVIVARDLGLRDSKELVGPDGGPIRTINDSMSPQEAAAAYAATLSGHEG